MPVYIVEHVPRRWGLTGFTARGHRQGELRVGDAAPALTLRDLDGGEARWPACGAALPQVVFAGSVTARARPGALKRPSRFP